MDETNHRGVGGQCDSPKSSRAFPRLESIDVIHQPRPEEPAKHGVSKDGRKRDRATAILRDAVLRTAPQDEVRGFHCYPSGLIGFMESVCSFEWLNSPRRFHCDRPPRSYPRETSP